MTTATKQKMTVETLVPELKKKRAKRAELLTKRAVHLAKVGDANEALAAAGVSGDIDADAAALLADSSKESKAIAQAREAKAIGEREVAAIDRAVEVLNGEIQRLESAGRSQLNAHPEVVEINRRITQRMADGLIEYLAALEELEQFRASFHREYGCQCDQRFTVFPNAQDHGRVRNLIQQWLRRQADYIEG